MAAGPQTNRLLALEEEELKTANLELIIELMGHTGLEGDPALRTMEDIRERLVLIRRKQLGTNHDRAAIFGSVSANNHAKTRPLVDLYERVRGVFSPIQQEPLSDVLRKEEYLDEKNLLEELVARKEALVEEETKVLVLGETNGGKTTFLNLLLGEQVLPTAVTHCTIAKCQVKYSPTYRVEITEPCGAHTSHPCQDVGEARSLLEASVTEDNVRRRANTSSLKQVTLFMPSEFLKTGVTLVDTPGIGESPELDQLTLDFVSTSQAAGFIYIIKTDNAGGIHEDRLMPFLEAIRKKYSSGTLRETFDPGASLFICNRWDYVPVEDREKMKQDAFRKLKSAWPGFEPTQAFFFSSLDAQKHLHADPDFVTDGFHALLLSIKKLFVTSSNNAIRSQYSWLKNVIHPASRHLRTMINSLIRSNDDLDTSFREVKAKQETLLSYSNQQVAVLRSNLEGHVSEVTEFIQDLLDLRGQDVSLILPQYQDILDRCSQGRYLADKANRRNLDETLIEHLLQYVDEEVRGRHIIEEVEVKVLKAIECHLNLFEVQVRQIMSQLKLGFRRHSSTSECPGDTRDSFIRGMASQGAGPISEQETVQEAARRHSTCSEVVDLGSSFGSSVSSHDEESDSVLAFTAEPARMAANVKSLLRKSKQSALRHTRWELRKKVLDKFLNRSKGKTSDAASYIQERCVLIGRDIQKNEKILMQVVAGYAGWIQDCGDYAAASIPKFAAVNNEVMDQIKERRELLSEDKDNLKHAMTMLEPCRQQLTGYGSLYMNDVQAELLKFTLEKRASSINIPSELSVSTRRAQDSGFVDSGSTKGKIRSFWASIQSVTIAVNCQPVRVVVKSYRNEPDEQSLLAEIAALRCLVHDHVAPFYGNTRLKSREHGGRKEVAGFIFTGDLVSMAVYANRRTVVHRDWLPFFFDELLQGLGYIHSHKLVHMELNANTVTVDKETGRVKLCHFGLARKAHIPASNSTTFATAVVASNASGVDTTLDTPGEMNDVRTSDSAPADGPTARAFVCLSPRVLRGGVYSQKDDLYALGLLLWEFLFPSSPKPYLEERQWPLGKFVEQCSPVRMLKGRMEDLGASEAVLAVLKGTVLQEEEEMKEDGNAGLTVSGLRSLLNHLAEDLSIHSLPARRRDPKIRRSSNESRGSGQPVPAAHPNIRRHLE